MNLDDLDIDWVEEDNIEKSIKISDKLSNKYGGSYEQNGVIFEFSPDFDIESFYNDYKNNSKIEDYTDDSEINFYLSIGSSEFPIIGVEDNIAYVAFAER